PAGAAARPGGAPAGASARPLARAPARGQAAPAVRLQGLRLADLAEQEQHRQPDGQSVQDHYDRRHAGPPRLSVAVQEAPGLAARPARGHPDGAGRSVGPAPPPGTQAALRRLPATLNASTPRRLPRQGASRKCRSSFFSTSSTNMSTKPAAPTISPSTMATGRVWNSSFMNGA